MSASRSRGVRFKDSNILLFLSSQMTHQVVAIVKSSLLPRAPLFFWVRSQSIEAEAQWRSARLFGRRRRRMLLMPWQFERRWSAVSTSSGQKTQFPVPVHPSLRSLFIVRILFLRASQQKIFTFMGALICESMTNLLSETPLSFAGMNCHIHKTTQKRLEWKWSLVSIAQLCF